MTSVQILEELFQNTTRSVVFSSRPEAIPGDLRISWRISTLCLVMQKFRGNRARAEHLHLIWWAMRTAANRELFARWMNGDKRPDEAIVRFDPALSTTVDLALGQGLVTRSTSGVITLTDSGKELARAINNDVTVLSVEKDFLGAIPNKLTQAVMNEVAEWT